MGKPKRLPICDENIHKINPWSNIELVRWIGSENYEKEQNSDYFYIALSIFIAGKGFKNFTRFPSCIISVT